MTTPTAEVVLFDGREWYQWDFKALVPKNWTPESGVLILCAPPGGIANIPAIVEGKRGFTPTFVQGEITQLAADDETPMTISPRLVSPGTDTTPPVIAIDASLKQGADGNDGTMTILDATDLDRGEEDANLQDGYILQLKDDGEGGFTVTPVALKVGNMYWPTSINTLTNEDGLNPLCSIVIPAQSGGYRIMVDGQQEISPDGPDIKVDLVARLSGTGTGTGATDGNVIARGQGVAGGADQNLVLSPAPPVGSAPGFGEVTNGASRTVYINLEQVGSGTDTVDTISGRGFFSARVEPLP